VTVSGTALWFGAPEFEILAVRDDGAELIVEVQSIRPRRPRLVA
jgi:hypothetical protein